MTALPSVAASSNAIEAKSCKRAQLMFPGLESAQSGDVIAEPECPPSVLAVAYPSDMGQARDVLPSPVA